MQTLELGIHFGLGEEAYFADKGLGSTAQKELAIDPIEYQYKRLHGAEKEDTASTLWGKALHARTIEGREAFESRFAAKPRKEDFKGLLVTIDDLRSYARAHDIKISGTKKEDVIRSVRAADAVVPIWDEIIEDFEADAEGLHILPAEVAEQIETAARWMGRDKYVGPFMQDGTFNVGAPEVSIFAEVEGVRLRMRIDRLLPHAIVDLKSFRPLRGFNTRKESVDKHLGRVIAEMRHDLQGASYLRTWDAARELFKQGRVFNATPDDNELLRRAFTREDMKFVWVLVKNTGAPQTFVREWELAGHTLRNADNEIEIGLDDFRRYSAEFGPDADWAPDNQAGKLTDEDFPTYMGA
jgi:hypothetical protein